MKTLVITAGFYDRDYDQKIDRLMRSAQRFDIDLKVYGKQESFSFYDSKIKKMGQFLNQFKKKYTHVLYTDAQDSLFLSYLDEILAAYRRFGVPMVVSGEKTCYPYPDFEHFFPASPTAYRYFNIGNFIGEIPYVMDCISNLARYYYINNNDNAHWMLGFAERRVNFAIDHECKIFQTMADVEWGKEVAIVNGRVKNFSTKTYPKIIHFNGPKGEGTVNHTLYQRVYDEVIA